MLEAHPLRFTITVTTMIKKTLPVLLLAAMTSYAAAGLGVSEAGGGSLALDAGTASVKLNVDYVNNTGGTVTFLGAEVLQFALSSNRYVGSGVDLPSLDNAIPNIGTNPFVDLGVTSAFSPEGTFAANNFVGFNLANGESITLGELDVTIPADFLGEFIVESTAGDLAVSVIQLPDPINEGSALDGLVTVGTGTIVPEPSSFLFLGLVGTGALGVRFFRRDEVVEDEEVA